MESVYVIVALFIIFLICTNPWLLAILPLVILLFISLAISEKNNNNKVINSTAFKDTLNMDLKLISLFKICAKKCDGFTLIMLNREDMADTKSSDEIYLKVFLEHIDGISILRDFLDSEEVKNRICLNLFDENIAKLRCMFDIDSFINQIPLNDGSSMTYYHAFKCSDALKGNKREIYLKEIKRNMGD